jgi:hypothetical protein
MKMTSALSIRAASFLLGCAALSAPLRAGDGARRTWDFESDTPGAIARGFTNEVGRWEVAKVDGNHVLAHKASNENATFNIALVDGTSYKDLDLSVRMKAVERETDRGGGLVWRAKDKRNYYICRYNPLRGASYRVYKVVDGRRTQLQALILPEDLK